MKKIHKENQNQKGFTLIELLVVIAIIGLLSSISFTSLQSARDKAKVVRILNDFRQIETALTVFVESRGDGVWFWDDELCSPACWNLENLVANTDFKDHCPSAPVPPVAAEYHYDYDPGTPTFTCGGNISGGVNIILTGGQELFEDIQNAYEKDNNKNCGKIRYNDTALWYMISKDGKSF